MAIIELKKMTLPLLPRLHAQIQALREIIAEARERQRVMLQVRQELEALTDRELSELGIARCDIWQIATKAGEQAVK